MCNDYQKVLDTIATEYAMSSMSSFEPFCDEFQKVIRHYRTAPTNNLKKCEADIRTLCLSRPFVVASCCIEDGDTYFSDFSGKKLRQTILKDFPERRMCFRYWYGNNQKPYQHKDLYDHILKTLGTIGTIAPNVNHPIGYCAEQNVANRLMLATNRSYKDIIFSIAIRPKTGEIVPYCDNCKKLFNQLDNGMV